MFPLVIVNSIFEPPQTSRFQDFIVQEKEKCEGQNSYTKICFYFIQAIFAYYSNLFHLLRGPKSRLSNK